MKRMKVTTNLGTIDTKESSLLLEFSTNGDSVSVLAVSGNEAGGNLALPSHAVKVAEAGLKKVNEVVAYLRLMNNM